jgi:ankyrin repeat protein
MVSAGCKPAARLIVLAVLVAFSAGAADTLSEKLQRGLFEEEANHNLDAAIKAYQSVVAQSDEQRKLIATAVFRLGECYRKLGKTNEANAQYQRVMRDYSDQEPLAKLTRQLLGPAAENTRVGGGFGKGFKELMQSVAGASSTGAGDSELSRILERRRAELQSELIIKRAQWEQLSKLNPNELLKAAPQVFNDAILASLQEELNRQEREFPLRGVGRPEIKTTEQSIKIVRKQIEDRVDALLSGMRSQVEALAAQVAAVDAELGKSKEQKLKVQEEVAVATDDEEKELQRLRAMLRDSPDLVNRAGGADTRLHQLAQQGKLRVAKFLLENKADVNAKNGTGDTPLHLAASQGQKSMVELLLEHGADVNANSRNGSPLHGAANRGYRAVVELLLARKADANAKDASNETPLHRAVRSGFTSIAELLLKNGADPNAKSRSGTAPLHLAAENGALPLVTLLLANHANPNESGQRRDNAVVISHPERYGSRCGGAPRRQGRSEHGGPKQCRAAALGCGLRRSSDCRTALEIQSFDQHKSLLGGGRPWPANEENIANDSRSCLTSLSGRQRRAHRGGRGAAQIRRRGQRCGAMEQRFYSNGPSCSGGQ